VFPNAYQTRTRSRSYIRMLTLRLRLEATVLIEGIDIGRFLDVVGLVGTEDRRTGTGEHRTGIVSRNRAAYGRTEIVHIAELLFFQRI
jgi:hypothetical protein